ncbi:hypothetical protein C0J52_20204 [Blattella germanica]|nr:hypothetical protein C0J52_20204 [Blattella germanica]
MPKVTHESVVGTVEDLVSIPEHGVLRIWRRGSSESRRPDVGTDVDDAFKMKKWRTLYRRCEEVNSFIKSRMLDEPRARTGVTTWTTDLDVNNIKASQSPKRSHIVRAGVQSPPDVANLSNHSVLKGSFSLLPSRLTQSTLISEGVGQEQLNQTWPPPASGRHSPRIPKKSSSKKRGRRILEPLNGPGSPRQGVPPLIVSRGKSPGPKAPSRGTSPRPRGASSTSRGVSPSARSPSPMRIRSTSSGRHKIPPLSPRKKKEPVETSAFVNLPSFKDDVSH